MHAGQNLCLCGAVKWQRSAHCQDCAKRIMQTTKLGRKDHCACGRMKERRAPQCQTCFKEATKQRRQDLHNQCRCGYMKDKRAEQCRFCRSQEPDTKTCTRCRKPFPIEAYSLRPNGHGSYKRRSRCTDCESQEAQIYRANYPERVRLAKKRTNQKPENKTKARIHSRRRSWRQMGLDPDAIETMLQNAAHCAICGVSHTKKRLGPDHDHKTGQFRGLLCSKCNCGIGLFNDNPHLLERAAQYLKRHQQPTKQSVSQPQLFDGLNA